RFHSERERSASETEKTLRTERRCFFFSTVEGASEAKRATTYHFLRQEQIHVHAPLCGVVGPIAVHLPAHTAVAPGIVGEPLFQGGVRAATLRILTKVRHTDRRA